MPDDNLRNALAILSEERARAQKEVEALQEARSSDAFDDVLDRIQAEAAHRPIIDKVCREWIASFEWPPQLAPEESMLIWDRVREAEKFCGFLIEAGMASEKVVSELLEWLLISYWHNLGVLHWRTVMKHLPRP
jgi:hypothetical protein